MKLNNRKGWKRIYIVVMAATFLFAMWRGLENASETYSGVLNMPGMATEKVHYWDYILPQLLAWSFIWFIYMVLLHVTAAILIWVARGFRNEKRLDKK